jgi:hypothetical protein
VRERIILRHRLLPRVDGFEHRGFWWREMLMRVRGLVGSAGDRGNAEAAARTGEARLRDTACACRIRISW